MSTTNDFTMPVVAAIGGTAAVSIPALYATYKHLTKKPIDSVKEVFDRLQITEWCLIGKNRINKGNHISIESQDDFPVFNPKTNAEIEKIAQMFRNSVNSACNTPLPNLIVTGKPGVGKSKLVRYLCKETGISYIQVPSGAFERFLNMGTHSHAMREIVNIANEFARESGKGCAIIIDDGEKIVEKRTRNITVNRPQSIPGLTWARDDQKRLSETIGENRVALVNTILEETGKEHRYVAVFVTTNRPEVIDDAFVSRSNNLVIDPPGFEERKKIFVNHIKKIFANNISLRDYFSHRLVTDMAYLTEGLTGRNLVKILEEIHACAQSRNNDINDEIIHACILTVSRAAGGIVELPGLVGSRTQTAEAQMTPKVLESAEQISSKTNIVSDQTESLGDHSTDFEPKEFKRAEPKPVQSVAKTTVDVAKEYFDMLVESIKFRCS